VTSCATSPTRFAADPLAGLAELARTSEADVVVALEASVGEGAPDAAFSAALVLVRPGTEAGDADDVTVLLDGGAGGRSALRLAAQAALARGGRLEVGATEGRRAARQAASAVEGLRRRGIDARAAGELPQSGLLVVPADAAGPETAETVGVLRVRPDEADLDEELEQSVDRIALPAAAGSPEPIPPAS
jgi:hypothetical protein